MKRPKTGPKKINSRTKGAAGEREVANILKEAGYDARRGQQFSGGSDSPDVLGLPGCHIEVKRTEAGNPYKWLAQAKADAGLNTPLVIHRRNGHNWIVIMELDEFLSMMESRGALP